MKFIRFGDARKRVPSYDKFELEALKFSGGLYNNLRKSGAVQLGAYEILLIVVGDSDGDLSRPEIGPRSVALALGTGTAFEDAANKRYDQIHHFWICGQNGSRRKFNVRSPSSGRKVQRLINETHSSRFGRCRSES